MCQNCVETRARQEEQKRSAEELRKTEKKRKIINKYGEKKRQLTLTVFLYLKKSILE